MKTYSTQFNFFKSWYVWDNVEKYGTAEKAKDDNITWRMRCARWVTNGSYM